MQTGEQTKDADPLTDGFDLDRGDLSLSAWLSHSGVKSSSDTGIVCVTRRNVVPSIRLREGRRFRFGAMDLNLALAHEAIAAAVPDRECIVFRDRRLTWREVTERHASPRERAARPRPGHGHTS